MDKKQEILAKSRLEKKDEGVEFAQNKGRGIGISGMMIVFVFLMLYNLVKGKDNDAIFALFWTYTGLESYGQYKIRKEKALLVAGIAGMIAGVTYLINYVVGTWG